MPLSKQEDYRVQSRWKGAQLLSCKSKTEITARIGKRLPTQSLCFFFFFRTLVTMTSLLNCHHTGSSDSLKKISSNLCHIKQQKELQLERGEVEAHTPHYLCACLTFLALPLIAYRMPVGDMWASLEHKEEMLGKVNFSKRSQSQSPQSMADL